MMAPFLSGSFDEGDCAPSTRGSSLANTNGCAADEESTERCVRVSCGNATRGEAAVSKTSDVTPRITFNLQFPNGLPADRLTPENGARRNVATTG